MVKGLKDKVINGVFWTIIGKIGLFSSKFIFGILLARLLTPKDFGLVGMILVFFEISKVLIESGFGKAYIQKKVLEPLDAPTIFYFNLLLSVVLYVVLWFAAIPISNFYNQHQIIELMRVMGVVVVINGFAIIQTATLSRAMEFKKQSKINIISSVGSGIIGVSFAYFGFGVWSLVIMALAERLINVSMLWFASKWTPGFAFSFDSFKSMFSYSGWTLLEGLFRRIFDNIYILTIGKFFPINELGFYTKGKQFSHLASRQLSRTIAVVSFPTFSMIQDNITKMKHGMQQFLKHSTFVLVPVSIALIVVAKPFVLIFLTEKWAPMIPYIQLLSLVGIIRPMHQVNLQLLKARGDAKLSFYLGLVKNSLRIINIIVMYKYSITFIIIGEVIISYSSILINTYYTKRFVNYGIIEQLSDIKFIILGGFVALIIGSACVYMIDHLWISFIIGIICSGGIFIFIQYLFDKEFLVGLKQIKKRINVGKNNKS